MHPHGYPLVHVHTYLEDLSKKTKLLLSWAKLCCDPLPKGRETRLSTRKETTFGGVRPDDILDEYVDVDRSAWRQQLGFHGHFYEQHVTVVKHTIKLRYKQVVYTHYTTETIYELLRYKCPGFTKPLEIRSGRVRDETTKTTQTGDATIFMHTTDTKAWIRQIGSKTDRNRALHKLYTEYKGPFVSGPASATIRDPDYMSYDEGEFGDWLIEILGP